MVLGNNPSGNLFDTTLTTNGTLYADSSGIITSSSPGNAGEVWTSNGVGSPPTFQAAGGGGFGSPTYFQAYLNAPQSISSGGSQQTVVFNATTANVGSAYNTGTGLFTAPTTGFYGFSVILYLDGILATNGKTNNGYVGSVQGGIGATYGTECFATTGALSFSYSWAMPMTAGDTVNVFSESDGSGSYSVYGEAITTNGGPQSKFSGWRIA